MEKPLCKIPVDLLMKWSERLSDEELGILFRALYTYVVLNIAPSFTGHMLTAWNDVISNLIPCE